MYTIFAILIVIASILLIGVILIQKSKGGGLAANVSGYNSMLGVRQTTDFVEKATWGLSIFICVLSIASAFVTAPSIVEGAPQIKKLPTSETQAPNFGTPAEQAPAAAASAAKEATVPAKEAAAPAKEAAAPAKEAAAPAKKEEGK